jgi:AraC-like DNA-binding protein
LNTLLKDLTGKTASAFIQERLMQEAKAYLMHTHLQVAEIAHKLGFGSPAYFNRFFKSNAGETPLQFRKQSRQ